MTQTSVQDDVTGIDIEVTKFGFELDNFNLTGRGKVCLDLDLVILHKKACQTSFPVMRANFRHKDNKRIILIKNLILDAGRHRNN